VLTRWDGVGKVEDAVERSMGARLDVELVGVVEVIRSLLCHRSKTPNAWPVTTLLKVKDV
jgi:hypothetical protein